MEKNNNQQPEKAEISHNNKVLVVRNLIMPILLVLPLFFLLWSAISSRGLTGVDAESAGWGFVALFVYSFFYWAILLGLYLLFNIAISFRKTNKKKIYNSKNKLQIILDIISVVCLLGVIIWSHGAFFKNISVIFLVILSIVFLRSVVFLFESSNKKMSLSSRVFSWMIVIFAVIIFFILMLGKIYR